MRRPKLRDVKKLVQGPWWSSSVGVSQYAKVAGLIPSQGTFKNQQINVSVSVSVPVCLSVSAPPFQNISKLKKVSVQGHKVAIKHQLSLNPKFVDIMQTIYFTTFS